MLADYFGRNLVCALPLLPIIVPTMLSTVAWIWILDPTSAARLAVGSVKS